MNSKNFKPGDILRATHRNLKEGYHPVIYVSGHSEMNFIGAMLTHHNDTTRNVLVDLTYFVKKIGYENTYLVVGRFIKPEEWGPFTKINQVTPEGLSFVNRTIGEQPLETFAKYFCRKL